MHSKQQRIGNISVYYIFGTNFRGPSPVVDVASADTGKCQRSVLTDIEQYAVEHDDCNANTIQSGLQLHYAGLLSKPFIPPPERNDFGNDCRSDSLRTIALECNC